MTDRLEDMPKPEELESAKAIPGVLAERYKDAERVEFARLIYNEAIDDAVNFLKDIAPKNPEKRPTLEAAFRVIGAWLTIPK